MIKITKMFNAIAKLKVYFSRAGMYISILNFLMLLATFKLSYNIQISAIIIIPLGLIFTLIIGWIDYKLVMVHEMEHVNKQNDIKTQLNIIQKKLEDMEKLK